MALYDVIIILRHPREVDMSQEQNSSDLYPWPRMVGLGIVALSIIIFLVGSHICSGNPACTPNMMGLSGIRLPGLVLYCICPGLFGYGLTMIATGQFIYLWHFLVAFAFAVPGFCFQSLYGV